jgi:epoxyqueuosine reductase
MMRGELLSSRQKIADCARGCGIRIVGFASMTGLERLLHPSIEKASAGLVSAVSLAYRLSDAVLDTVEDGPTLLYKHHYKTVNWILDQCAARVVGMIEADGFRALAVPASQTVDWEKQVGHLSHKAVAVASGLGWIGKSGLLVNETHGARLRFSTILTNLPLGATDKAVGDCGDCTNCIDSCPASALSNEGYDKEKCLAELKGFAARSGIGVYICGVCVKACPTGRR